MLQTAANATVSDAAARSSLYVFALSSSLVALRFASRSRDVIVPFGSIVLPGLFVFGVLTIVRLVDSALENVRYLVALFTTSAGAIALINNIVAGVGVALLTSELAGRNQTRVALLAGAIAALLRTAAFLAYERWRFRVFDRAPDGVKQTSTIQRPARVSTHGVRRICVL